MMLTEISIWVLGWFVFLVLFPFLVVFFSIAFLYKFIVNQIVRCKHPGWLQLQSADYALAANFNTFKSSGKLLNNIVIAFVVNGDVGIEELRERVQEKLLFTKLPMNERQRNRNYRFDRLRRTIVNFMGHLYWSDEMRSVDIKAVVKEQRTTTTDFESRINKWQHTMYEDGAPIWGIMLYKNNDEFLGKSVIVIKISHVLGDGYSIRTLAQVLAGTNEDREYFKEALAYRKGSWVTPIELLSLLCNGPYLILKMLGKILFVEQNVLSRRDRIPETLTCFLSVELEPLKKIRRTYDCKFHDVVIALFGNVLRRHLLETNLEDKLPQTITFAIAVEVPNRPTEICNQATMLFVKVPIAGEDRQGKLIQLKDHTRKVMESATHKLYYYLAVFVLDCIPTSMLPVEDRPSINPAMCCAMTTLPGLRDSEYFGSYPVDRILAFQGQQIRQLAFIGATLTHGNKVEVALLGNRGAFKNVDTMNRLKTYVHEELQLMLETTIKADACGVVLNV